jgi:hypothetical protein
MTLDELRATKRDAILAIAAKHGVSGIRVFGSFARGETRNDSDLDLLIEAGPARTPLFPRRLPCRPGGLRGGGVRPAQADSGPGVEGGRASVKSDRLYVEHILECIERPVDSRLLLSRAASRLTARAARRPGTYPF